MKYQRPAPNKKIDLDIVLDVLQKHKKPYLNGKVITKWSSEDWIEFNRLKSV